MPASGLPWLRAKDKKFTLDDDMVAPTLRAVVADYVYENSYYLGTYTPGHESAPVCWALSEYQNTMQPDEACPEPQSAACDTCPRNEFELAANGAMRKACRNNVKLALLVVSADGTEFFPALLRIAPSSLKNFKSFVAKTLQLFRLPPCGVAVTIGFDRSTTYSKFTFSNVERVTDPKLIAALSSYDYASLRETLLRGFEAQVARAARTASSENTKEAGDTDETIVGKGGDEDVPF
jgi:hypothetical protein